MDGPVTVYPEEFLTLPVPEHLINKEVVITPTKAFAGMFRPRVMAVNETFKLENITPFPTSTDTTMLPI